MNNIIKLSDYKNNGVPIMVRACDLKKSLSGHRMQLLPNGEIWD